MALPWKDVAANPEYRALSRSDKLAAQDQYYREILAPQVDEVDRDALRDQFSAFARDYELSFVEPKKEEDAGFGISDIGNALQVGYGSAAQGVGWAAEKLGLDDDNSIREYWNQYTKEQAGQYSDRAKEARGKDMSFDDVGGALIKIATGATESIPAMVMSAPIGAGVSSILGKTAAMLYGAEVGGAGMAYAAGAATPLTFGGRVAASAPGVAGASVGEGVAAGLTNSAQIKSQILDRPLSEVENTPGFVAIHSQLGNIQDPLERNQTAHRMLADAMANSTFLPTLAATAGLGAVAGGGVMGQMLTRDAARKAGTAAEQGLMKRTISGAGEEARQEFLQSGSDKLIENLRTQEFIDPNQATWEGVPRAAVEGALTGAAMGGVFGAADIQGSSRADQSGVFGEIERQRAANYATSKALEQSAAGVQAQPDLDSAITAANTEVDTEADAQDATAAFMRETEVPQVEIPATPLPEVGSAVTPSQQPGVALEPITQGIPNETQRSPTALPSGIPLESQKIPEQPAPVEQSANVPDVAQAGLVPIGGENGATTTPQNTRLDAGADINAPGGTIPSVAGVNRASTGTAMAATREGEPVLGGRGESAVAPIFATDKKGNLRVTGFTKEQVSKARDTLKIRGAIIGNNGNAIFPKGTNEQAVREALGAEPKVKEVKQRKPARASADLMMRIRQLGGVDSGAMTDITGEKDRRQLGGWRFTFKNGGRGLDDLAISLAGEGFAIDTNDVDGGVQQLKDMIRSHINGERNFRNADIEDAAQAEHDSRYTDDLMRRADDLGLNVRGMTEIQVADAVWLAEDDIRMAAVADQGEFTDEEMADAHEVADAVDNIPFGDNVKTNTAALEAWLGGDNEQESGRNTTEASTGAAQADTGRSEQADEAAQGFQLQSQTEAELSAAEEAQRQADATRTAEENAQRREDERLNVGQLSVAAASDFQLGQSAEDNLTGQRDIFAAPSNQKTRSGQQEADSQTPAPDTRSSDAPLNTGDVFITTSGRDTTPFPKYSKTAGKAQTTKDEKGIRQWLKDNAIAEAEDRGDDFNLAQWKSLNINNWSPADGDAVNLYLFNDETGRIGNLKKITTQPSDQSKQSALSAIKKSDIPAAEQIKLAADLRKGNVSPEDVQAVLGEKIEDFGEKIAGAKKEYAAAYKDKIADAKGEDIIAVPLSKSWPEPDYQKLLEAGHSTYSVALARSMRDEIPTKPQKAYRQKTWAKQVEQLRDTATGILNSREIEEAYRAEFKKAEHLRLDDAINGRAELYQMVGHKKSLKGVRVSRGSYTLYGGIEYSPPKIIWEITREAKATAFGNMPHTLASGATREEAMEGFKRAYDSLDSEKNSKPQTKFELYADRNAKAGSSGQYFIGKKVGRNVMHIKDGFDTVKEARLYMAEHNDELTAILEEKKAIPQERADTNRPRVGQDMRNGQDVTPTMFGEAFGFRGVQFGNYVEGKRRQQDLNNTYDALMDMAAVLDIPPRAISLNGELGLAFGARGSGGKNPAAAHYESDQVVINLTKGDGAGSLGHEWWHALDNYFSRLRGKTDGMATTALDVSLAARNAGYQYKDDGVRKEMIEAFGAVVRSINSTAMKERSKSLDSRRTKEYWGTGEEMAARAFERYLIAKLHDQGAANDYLANVVDEEYWNSADALGIGEGGSYPYPTESELPAVRAGFDHFFQTIETKETDKGTALYSRTETPVSGKTVADFQPLADKVNAKLSDGRKVVVLQSERDLVGDIIQLSDGSGGFIEGAYLGDKTAYIVADSIRTEKRFNEVLTHELHHMAGSQTIESSEYKRAIKNIQAMEKAGNKTINELAFEVDRRQPDLSNPESASYSLENRAKEIMAMAAETGRYKDSPTLAKLFADILRAFKRFARKMGLDFRIVDKMTVEEVFSMMRAGERAMYRDSGVKDSLNTGEYEPDYSANPSIVKSESAPWYYSALAKAIKTAPERVFNQPAQGFKAWIQSNSDKMGVKKDELHWTGLLDWLDTQGKARVTREQVGEYLASGGVQLHETVLSDNGKNFPEFDFQEYDTSSENIWVETDDEGNDKYADVLFHKYSYKDISGEWESAGTIIENEEAGTFTVEAEGSQISDEFSSLEEAERSMQDYARDRRDSEIDKQESDTKYSDYKLPGGENYREFVLTLPSNDKGLLPKGWVVEKYSAPLGIEWRVRDKEGNIKAGGLLSQERAEQAALDLAPAQATKDRGDFKSSHWDQPNVVAHMRVDTVEGADGKKYLRVIEAQSDHGQEGRKKGFGDAKRFAELRKQMAVFEDKINKSDIDEAAALMDIPEYAKLAEESKAVNPEGKVPSAPFVQDTKAWTSLIIKRAIALASKEGMDGVVFASGQESADLYDLSKQVDSVEWAKYDEGRVDVYFEKRGQPGREKAGRFKIEELEGVVGKELASKISKEFDAGAVNGDYSGLDLMVGGEGMLKFYDEIIPQVANDVLKKVGAGVKVETVGADTRRIGFHITPEFAAKVNESGLPLFSRKSQGGEVSQKDNPDALPAESKEMAARRVSQDAMIRFREIQKWLKDQGVNISEAANVYVRENLGKATTANQIEDFRNFHIEPLIKEIAASGFEMGDIVDYLEALHIPEANKRMRQIHNDPKATANGVSDADAKAVLDEFRAMPKFAELEKLADKIAAIGSETLDMRLAEGLISQEQYDAYKDTYQHWVPLRGNMPNQQGFGRGMSTNAKQKRRFGHEARDEFIFENLVADRERAIFQIEHNKLGRTLANFILEAGNPDIGTVNKPEKRATLADSSYAVMYQGKPVGSFQNRSDAQNHIMRTLAHSSSAFPGMSLSANDFTVEKTFDPHIVMLARPMLAENEVQFYVKGQAIRIQLNDPLLARAATNGGMDRLVGTMYAMRQINNFLSKAYTAWSPDFLLVNPIRDIYQGAVVLAGKEGAGFAANAMKNYGWAWKELWKSHNDTRESEWVTRYRKAGGNTGAAYLSDIERVGEDTIAALREFEGVQRTYSQVYEQTIEEGGSKAKAATKASLAAGISGGKRVPVLGHFLRLMERLNGVFENTLRLATFKAAIESGKSDQESARLAKDLMNFNRKGERAGQMGALYLFFNPAMQGSQVVMQSILRAPHKDQARIILGGLAMAGFLLAEIARSGDDEDERDWRSIPEYIKARNMVVKVGDNQVMIPVAYGFGIFHSLGMAMSDMLHGVDSDKVSLNMADALFENFSVFGNPVVEKDGAIEIRPEQMLPTIPKMAIGPSTNMDSMGRSIAPQKYKAWQPDSQNMTRSMRGTVYADISSAMNEWTGGSEFEKGTIDVSPNVLRYWVSSVLGGAGRFTGDVFNLGKGGIEGVAPEIENIPVARKFLRESDVADSRSEFWDAKSKASLALAAYTAAIRAGDKQAARRMLEDEKPYIALAKMAEATAKLGSEHRNLVAKININDNLSLPEKRLKIKQIEAAEKKLYDRFMKLLSHAELNN